MHQVTWFKCLRSLSRDYSRNKTKQKVTQVKRWKHLIRLDRTFSLKTSRQREGVILVFQNILVSTTNFWVEHALLNVNNRSHKNAYNGFNFVGVALITTSALNKASTRMQIERWSITDTCNWKRLANSRTSQNQNQWKDSTGIPGFWLYAHKLIKTVARAFKS